MIIIPLAPHHDRKGFDCGEEKVNSFLKERARKHAALNLSRTSVLVEDETSPHIMGYHATLVTSVEPVRVPVKKLARIVYAYRNDSGIDRQMTSFSSMHESK